MLPIRPREFTFSLHGGEDGPLQFNYRLVGVDVELAVIVGDFPLRGVNHLPRL